MTDLGQIKRAVKTPTLGEKLGMQAKDSQLLQKAERLGLRSAELLESLAIARGCWHYDYPGLVPAPPVAESQLSNEELAVALLSPCLPYSPRSIRIGAAMLGARGNEVQTLARLVVEERCVAVARYIAGAGLRYEPENPFWSDLLRSLPEAAPPPDGVMPHPTRFVEMTGIDREHVGLKIRWLRPLQPAAA